MKIKGWDQEYEVKIEKSEYAYVDTNNMPNAEDFINENKLGEFAGEYKNSGFCWYPLYKFY